MQVYILLMLCRHSRRVSWNINTTIHTDIRVLRFIFSQIVLSLSLLESVNVVQLYIHEAAENFNGLHRTDVIKRIYIHTLYLNAKFTLIVFYTFSNYSYNSFIPLNLTNSQISRLYQIFDYFTLKFYKKRSTFP